MFYCNNVIKMTQYKQSHTVYKEKVQCANDIGVNCSQSPIKWHEGQGRTCKDVT